jgi:N-acetylmuramic acid 6-phosphate etherase
VTDSLPPTEEVDAATQGLDCMPTRELVGVLVDAQQRAIDAARRAAPGIAKAADEIAARLRAGGHLHYVGAGTSGRLGILEAAELPPTFGTAPSLARAHVAGGSQALVVAVEGAEDDAAAARELESELHTGDVVVGISASGGAAYVVAALELAKAAGAYAIALTSAPDSPLVVRADLAIVLETGPEPLAGSTRLVAATAHKIALNALSTATMVRLNKVYDNLMVDVVATNEKLRARAVRLVTAIAGVDESRARKLLGDAQGSVKVAVVMSRLGVTAGAARKALDEKDGSLRAVLSHSGAIPCA